MAYLEPVLRSLSSSRGRVSRLTSISRAFSSPQNAVYGSRCIVTSPRLGLNLYKPQTRLINTGGLTNLFDTSNIGGIQVRNVTEHDGIELEDGLTMKSSCILIGGRVFLWKTPESSLSSGEWTKDDFEIFDVLLPKPEILVFGTGKSLMLPPVSVREYLREIGVQAEYMDTRNACSTYNLLSEEGRRVAAALLPLSHRVW